MLGGDIHLLLFISHLIDILVIVLLTNIIIPPLS